MLQYTLLAYFVWGISPPDRIPDQQALANFPGDYPEELGDSADTVLAKLLAAAPSYSKGRLANVLFINSLVFTMLIVLSSLLFLVPWGLMAIVLVAFGPVATVSAAWSWFGAGAAVVSLASAVLSRCWVGVAAFIANAAVESRGEAHCQKVFAGAIGNVELLAQSGAITEVVYYDGQAFAPTDISNIAYPLAVRFAIATYHLYCPGAYEAYSTTTFSLLTLVLVQSRWLYRHIRFWTKANFWAFKWALICLIFTLCGSNRAVSALADLVMLGATVVVYPVFKSLWRGDWKAARTFVRTLFLLTVLKVMNYCFMLEVLKPIKDAKVAGDKHVKLRAAWNNLIMDFTRVLDNVSIPNFIRSLPDRFDREAINQGQQILADLGWPVSPEVVEAMSGLPANQGKYESSWIGGTSIRQGIVRLDLAVAAELSSLSGYAPEYKRTEQYATYENELESLSRYFDAPDLDIPDLPIDDVWLMVGEIFENSKLTPFNYILKKWEKKYGLGPFWGQRNPRTGRWRKLSRKAFISQIGGMGKMVKLWADTFKVAHVIPAVAPVSVKSEPLPEKKWRNDIVRTIIGAPIVHYISSTIWNYAPNHKFKFWSTNIKIGMPLNGANLSRLVRQHATYAFHFGGDFSAFDSTVTGKIVDIIKKVRKKGFERHRDYAKICFLIDQNYRGLLNMPMMTTSTGDLYKKVTGLSTGHSSTGMDNSLAVTILYIIAWKMVTGLSAHEFRHYCKLSNYGDDHVLSWQATAPASWHPDNIIKAMARIGVGLRDEFPKFSKDGSPLKKSLDDYRDLQGLAFLSKKWRQPTSSDRVEMEAVGIDCPDFIVYHDPVKLVGKAYAPTKDKRVDRNYRIKRLVSYLYLTAHHRELYDKIAYSIELIRTRKKGAPRMPSPVPIPSYEEVLRMWYDEDTVRTDPDDKPDEDEFYGKVIDYSLDGLADTLVNIVSVVPDVLNPAIYNMGYTNWLISQFGTRVAWPIELLRRSNGVSATGALSFLGKRTFYDFLFESPTLLIQPVDASDMSLLVRHWIYTLLKGKDVSPQWLKAVTWTDKKITEANFVLNGYVQPFVKRADLPLLEILTVAALSHVHVPGHAGLIRAVRLPTASFSIEYVIGYFVNVLWSKIPANMKQASSSIDTLSHENNMVLIEAPTGTGKSTTFVNFVFRYFGGRYSRVFLVEPRSLLVTSLAPYLRAAFGLPAVEITEGFPDVPAMKLAITTPQEVLLHEEWFNGPTLFLVDECHVDEPAVLALLHVLQRRRHPFICMTATPSAANLADCSSHVPLTIARTWQIVDDVRSDLVDGRHYDSPSSWWPAYRHRVLDLVRTRTLMKFLVFVPGKAHAAELASRIGRKCCVITSTSKFIDPKADVFIATAVADVGLTIPDVNWVVTSDLTRHMDTRTETLLWVRCDALLLKQRRGRTGRTSNGTFTCFRYPSCRFVDDKPAVTDATIGLEVLKTTGNANLVAQWWPTTISALWGAEVHAREDDDNIDLFAKNVAVISKIFESDKQKTYRLTVDGVTEAQFWNIAGNHIPTPVPLVPGSADKAKPLSIHDGWRFIVGAAHWAVKHGTLLTEKALQAYLEVEGISGPSFDRFMGRYSAGDFIVSTDPDVAIQSTRVGARETRALRNPLDEAGLFENFAYFDNPKPLPAVPQPIPLVVDNRPNKPVVALGAPEDFVWPSMDDEPDNMPGGFENLFAAGLEDPDDWLENPAPGEVNLLRLAPRVAAPPVTLADFDDWGTDDIEPGTGSTPPPNETGVALGQSMQQPTLAAHTQPAVMPAADWGTDDIDMAMDESSDDDGPIARRPGTPSNVRELVRLNDFIQVDSDEDWDA